MILQYRHARARILRMVCTFIYMRVQIFQSFAITDSLKSARVSNCIFGGGKFSMHFFLYLVFSI